MWTVRDDQFWRAPSYVLAWTADLSQVWVGDGSRPVLGRRVSGGALVKPVPLLLWSPHIDPVFTAYRPMAVVDVTNLTSAHVSIAQIDASPPAWAGPGAGGFLLSVDSDGDLSAVRD